jgi:hypothetical protein
MTETLENTKSAENLPMLCNLRQRLPQRRVCYRASSTGGFAAGKALEWIEQYCRLTGIALEPAA